MQKARSSGLFFYVLTRNLSYSSRNLNQIPSLARCSSTVANRPSTGGRRTEGSSEEFFSRKLNFGDKSLPEKVDKADPKPPAPIAGRPLRGEVGKGGVQEDVFPDFNSNPHRISRGRSVGAPRTGEERGGSRPIQPKLKTDGNHESFDFFGQKASARKEEDKREEKLKNGDPEQGGDRIGVSLFQKLKLGDLAAGGKSKEANDKLPMKGSTTARSPEPDSPPEDASEIFKKMKETGLIPNAVAMLDGLCKDGLVQEAMKLFGLMREKRTIPEVVIYTAVVEGFCKGAKFDDAKRIFRKMQKNGIVPNAFSYSVLIQGLCKGKRVDDAFEFSFEMVDAGHLLNGTTFTSLVDVTCKEKGIKEAQDLVRKLREKGYALDEKAIREHLDKKGPFSPMVWEAIFGKKSPQRSF